MKISARNQFNGRITEIKPSAVNGTVKVDIGSSSNGMIVTASITEEAIAELTPDLSVVATVIVKASDVLIGK